MQNEEVAAFIELAELDHRLERLKQQLDDEIAKKNRLQQEIDSIDQEIEAAYKHLHDTQKKNHELDLECKTIDRTLALTNEKLLRASSHKEIESLHHEKTDLEAKRGDFDGQGLILLEELEQARIRDSELRKQAPEKRRLKEVVLETFKDAITKTITALDNCSYDRTMLSNRSEKELVSRYEAMKKSVKNPAVSVIRESCSGCFYPLSPAEISVIAKGQIGTCKSCYRLLYITKKEPDA